MRVDRVNCQLVIAGELRKLHGRLMIDDQGLTIVEVPVAAPFLPTGAALRQIRAASPKTG